VFLTAVARVRCSQERCQPHKQAVSNVSCNLRLITGTDTKLLPLHVYTHCGPLKHTKLLLCITGKFYRTVANLCKSAYQFLSRSVKCCRSYAQKCCCVYLCAAVYIYGVAVPSEWYKFLLVATAMSNEIYKRSLPETNCSSAIQTLV